MKVALKNELKGTVLRGLVALSRLHQVHLLSVKIQSDTSSEKNADGNDQPPPKPVGNISSEAFKLSLNGYPQHSAKKAMGIADVTVCENLAFEAQ